MFRIRSILAFFTAFIFMLEMIIPPVWAQEILLPPAKGIISLSNQYSPAVLRGIKVDSKDPFKFEFVVDPGNSNLSADNLSEESQKLIKYFLAVITTPESDLWVNLSPYENNRIIQEDFGRTVMGRDLLTQDYILKQLTSSLMHPDSALGKSFWDRIYKRVYEKYGTTDIPLDTFNKVWIMPDEASIVENTEVNAAMPPGAFIEEARLKVMLESDYVAIDKNRAALASALEREPAAQSGASAAQNAFVKEVLREVVLPVLEKEVNEGELFAPLRQVYYSLLLAVWFKQKLQSAVIASSDISEKPGYVKGNILSLIYLDQHKTGGLETSNPKAEISTIYDRYVDAFKQGAYNLIREDYDAYSKEMIPRKYFSGGIDFAQSIKSIRPAGKGRNSYRNQKKPWSLFGYKISLLPRIYLKSDAKTGLYVEEDRRNTKTIYFQTNLKAAFKTFIVLAIVGAVGGFGYQGWKWYSSAPMEQSVSKVVEQSQVNQTAAVKERGDHITPSQIHSLLTDTTTAMRNYQTGNIHRKKGARPDLYAPHVSVKDFLQRMSTVNETSDMTEERLADILNDNYDMFGSPLEKVGLDRLMSSKLSLDIIAKENEGFMARSQMVGKNKDVIQARGVQFEYATYKKVMDAVSRITKNKDFTTSGTFQSFQQKIQEEIKKELGSETSNRWYSDDPNDLVVQTPEQLALMTIWFGHILEDQPIPPEVEFERLDAMFFLEKGKPSQWKNTQPALAQLLPKLLEKKKYSKLDLVTAAEIFIIYGWNMGDNVDSQLREYMLDFYLANTDMRDVMVKKAGLNAYVSHAAMFKAKTQVKNILKKINFSHPQIDNLFVLDSQARQNILRSLKPIYDAKSDAEKIIFKKAWKEYRLSEDKYRSWMRKLTNVPQAVKHPDYVLAAHRDPQSTYADGLVSRTNLDRYKKFADNIIDQIMKYKEGQKFVLPNFDLAQLSGLEEVINKLDRTDLVLINHDTGSLPQLYSQLTRNVDLDNLNPIQSEQDSAMGAPTGGIDLRTDLMKFNVSGKSGNFIFEIPVDKLSELKKDMDGLVPIIIDVQTLDSPAVFLGIK